MQPNRISTLFLALVCLGAGIWHFRGRAHSQPAPTPTPRVSLTLTQVSALARLEPAGKVVHLQVPAPRQMDRVERWHAQEGDRVSRGQLLVELDGVLRLSRELEVSRARVLQFEARLAQVQAGSKLGEVQRQQGEIRRLEAELGSQVRIRRDELARLATEESLARKNYDRFRQLYQQGACSALELEQRELSWNQARRLWEQARGELERSQSTLRAQLESARGELSRIQEVRPSDVQAALADIEQARSEVERARVALEECRIHAPQAGSLLRIHTRAGERIASQGLADLAETDSMVAVAEVYQNDVQRLRLGQSCRIVSAALPEALQGKVMRLGQLVQRQNIFSEQPGEQFDQRVVEVRIALEPQSSRLAANWTHLQVQAVFDEAGP